MKQQLIDLRTRMQQAGVDAYTIPTTDFHGSEYVNDYFKCRKFLSGFTGSAGTVVVTQEEAYLWTDGRYFLQATDQLKDTGIGLMKMGQPGVPTIDAYLKEKLTPESTIGFDGRVCDYAFGCKLESICKVNYELDLVGDIWKDRPAIKPSKIYGLPSSVTGETAASKLARVRSYMEKKGADYHLITKLEEIAWLFNVRGDDVANTPVFFSFALIARDHAYLYVMDETFKEEDVRPYFQIFEDIKTIPQGTILLDEDVVSYALVRSLPEKVQIINSSSPVTMMKALKNEDEIRSTKNAHLKDGAAMVNFIYWLKQTVGKEEITEISAADYLEQCRREQEGCYDLSFTTISGYMSNGAIVHYEATPATNKTLKPEGFLLVDSGGQYEDGTTDITRTIALGPLSQKMKEHYTTVLRCHIRLAMAKFPVGTTGSELDTLTRQPLHAIGLDYNHGTGHGVGHLLSVHEGPQTISGKPGCDVPFYQNMITSNEPGVYLEGEYGIRLENEILCVDAANGKLGFENLTFCPFDREAILPELLTEEELAWLNNYHREVYEKIAPRVSAETSAWLKEQTEKI
ncbi:aminopeptidase P family protein [Emergencia sp. JLR.KK010]|uniref:aminopeptidase P family protein n=1 Tax=Emergencia sp. JLR.KK010 TaxID=3114296 RepID=UPI0030CB6F80